MNKQKKKQKEKDNPLLHSYGILSNTTYILKKIRQYYPKLLWMMGIGILTNPLSVFLLSFISKYVIDIVQAQAASSEKDITPLIRLLIIAAVIELTVMLLNAYTDNRRGHQFIFVRMYLIKERVAKALSMKYESLEKPDILDLHEKALHATGSNDTGIEGLMRAAYDFGSQTVLMFVTFFTVAILDIRLILVLALLSFFQFLFFRHTVKQDRKTVWDVLPPTWRKISYMERVTQDFDYAKDIRLFHMKDWLCAKNHEILMTKQGRMHHSRDLWIYNSLFAHGILFLSNAAIYSVLIFAVVGRNLSIGNFTLYLGLAGTFSQAMNQVLISLGTYSERSLQTDDFRSFMDLNTEESGDFLPLPDTARLTFTFEDVSYQYNGSETFAVKHLNLTLSPGKRMAVVGLNGAGKTTFIKLLLGLYTPTEGRILLNGTDIRRFRRSEYFTLFSPVFQNVELLAFPLGENVSMKRPWETDSEKAIRCLQNAGLSEKLDALTDGIDTELLKIIDENGVDLSGGERQKLALARALYKDAPVMVLDEPTAALDALAEYQLYKRFDDIIGQKSAVYISHRLSSTRFCDAVAMFQDGELIEYGTHEELLAAGGAYADMFAVQAQYYKEEENGHETEIANA